MDGPLDFLINRVLMSISHIRSSAASYGGQCTWEFSQAKDPVRSIISKNSTTKAGICEMLSAKWISEAHKGRSMKNWLAGPTGQRSKIDAAKISLLGQTFGTGYQNQAVTTENWLRTNGINPRTNALGRTLSDQMGSPTSGNKFDINDELLEDITDSASKTSLPLYALITVAEKNRFLGHKGHTMALKLSGINGVYSAAYFDPNYGQFDFQNWNNFRKWFAFYYVKSTYARYMGSFYDIKYY